MAKKTAGKSILLDGLLITNNSGTLYFNGSPVGGGAVNISDITNGVSIDGASSESVSITHDGTQGVISSSTNNLDIYTGGVHNITIKNGQIIQNSTGGTLYLYGHGGASPGGQLSLTTNGFTLLAGGKGLVSNFLGNYVRVDNADFYLHTEGKRIYNSVGDLNLTGASTAHYVNIGQPSGQGVAGLRVYEPSGAASSHLQLDYVGGAGRIIFSGLNYGIYRSGGTPVLIGNHVSLTSHIPIYRNGTSVGRRIIDISSNNGKNTALMNSTGHNNWGLQIGYTSTLGTPTHGHFEVANNTSLGPANQEVVELTWDSNVALLRTNAYGTGSTKRDLQFDSANRAAHIADPSGGATIDAEARAAINAIIDTLESFGLSSTV